MTASKSIVLTAIFCFLCTVQSIAQTKHSIYLNVLGGYSSFLSDAKGVVAKGNSGGGLGAGYEFNYNAFVLQCGVEFTYLNADLQMDNFTISRDMLDTEGELYIGNYDFQNNSDHYRFANVNIPLMLGVNLGRFYFLAGGKLGFNISAQNSTEATVVSTGTYPQFEDDLHDMPDHYFYSKKETADFQASLASSTKNINAYLSGEAGVNFKASSKSAVKFRLAVFADYGLLNLRDNNINESATLDKNSYSPYLNSFMRSETMRGSFTNNLFAGLRFTVLFGFKEKPDCRCDY
ncbi:MAG: hypothetical protein LBN23_04590 [Paludibacter sp.]|jgi:hypothetical protein|nr:hypothetical protein [Paludibacter sp.]